MKRTLISQAEQCNIVIPCKSENWLDLSLSAADAVFEPRFLTICKVKSSGLNMPGKKGVFL